MAVLSSRRGALPALALAALFPVAGALTYQNSSKLPARYVWESPQTTVQLSVTPALLPGGVYATLTPQDFIAPPQHWVGALAHEGGKYKSFTGLRFSAKDVRNVSVLYLPSSDCAMFCPTLGYHRQVAKKGLQHAPGYQVIDGRITVRLEDAPRSFQKAAKAQYGKLYYLQQYVIGLELTGGHEAAALAQVWTVF